MQYPLQLKGGHRHYPIPWVTDQGIGEWKCANNPGSAGRARVWQDPGVSLARTVSCWGSAVGLGNIKYLVILFFDCSDIESNKLYHQTKLPSIPYFTGHNLLSGSFRNCLITPEVREVGSAKAD